MFYAFSPETLAQAFPDFDVLREVGKGSMGIVYEARRRTDGKRVALKVLPPSLTLTERTLTRFLREGELMSKVQHPSIVNVLEHGRGGRLHYIVMEFVDGTTAEERVRVGPLPERHVAEIGHEVARALQVAHEHGVVHRDVKPGNLILTETGGVAITDFGLAREKGTGSMTESGSIVGTPMYMAPEQVLGERTAVGTRSDVYGLGATLYHLATGSPPFEGPTAQSVLKAVLETEPVRPRRLRGDLSPALEAIIMTAMAKEPARRYGTAQDLAEDLGRFLHGDKVRARRPGLTRRGVRAAAKRPLLTALAAVVVLLSISAYMIYREHRWESLKSQLGEAENKIAQAAALRDDQLRPVSAQDRQGLLLSAAEAASEVLAAAPDFANAWFVRAQARHRLQEYDGALADLDEAELRLGGPTPELLYFRIETLRNLPGTAAHHRLLDDLMALLKVEPSPYTQCLVAEYLLDMAENNPEDREEILASTGRLLGNSGTARAAVARARLLELQGDRAGAEQAMRDALTRFHSFPVVHYHASQLFHRLGLHAESHEEAALARMLDPGLGRSQECERGRVDMAQFKGFLQQVDGLMSAIEPDANRDQ